MAPTAAWPICTNRPRLCYQIRLWNAPYSNSFGKDDNGLYAVYFICDLLIVFRLCHKLRRSYPVLQMQNRLPYQQITSTWLSLLPVRTGGTKRCRGIFSYWLKRHQMLLARVGRNRTGSERVRNQFWYDVVEAICSGSNNTLQPRPMWKKISQSHSVSLESLR